MSARGERLDAFIAEESRTGQPSTAIGAAEIVCRFIAVELDALEEKLMAVISERTKR